jgi:sugar lactone lactonase YvrE
MRLLPLHVGGLCGLLFAMCKPVPPERIRAGDAGFAYRPGARETGSLVVAPDHAARPAIDLVAGRPGGRGDLDGDGAEARLGLVGGMVRVGDSILFADESNGSLRRLTPASGRVETLVRLPQVEGGRAPLPAFVAYDGDADLYVSDRSRSVVYSFDLKSLALTIVAGRPSERGDADGDLSRAQLDSPAGLAFDGQHTLFVADVGNHSIRRIDLVRRDLSTLARGFLEVYGLCWADGTVYATDSLSSAVFAVDPRSGTTEAIAGSNRFSYTAPRDGLGTEARFYEPRGIACTKERLYVTDRGHGLLRTIDRADRRVRTLAGRVDAFGVRDGQSDGAWFDDPLGVVAFGDTTYVGDTASIRAVAIDDGRVRTVAGAPGPLDLTVARFDDASFRRPEGAAVVASEGAAYVADCGSATILRADLTTGRISVFAGSPGLRGFVDGSWDLARFDCPSSIAYDGQGTLFVGDHGNHALRSIPLPSRRVVTLAGAPDRCGAQDGPFASASLCEPASLAFGGEGELFVADSSTHTIRRVDLWGQSVTTLAGAPFERGWADRAGAGARFDSPASIVYRDGALFVADVRNHVVRRVDARSGAVDTLVGAVGQPGTADGPFSQARLDAPRALAPAGPDALLVFDRSSVRRLLLSARTSAPVVRAGRGLRTGTIGPELAEPFAALDLGAGAALVVDRAENVLVELLYRE